MVKLENLLWAILETILDVRVVLGRDRAESLSRARDFARDISHE